MTARIIALLAAAAIIGTAFCGWLNDLRILFLRWNDARKAKAAPRDYIPTLVLRDKEGRRLYSPQWDGPQGHKATCGYCWGFACNCGWAEYCNRNYIETMADQSAVPELSAADLRAFTKRGVDGLSKRTATFPNVSERLHGLQGTDSELQMQCDDIPGQAECVPPCIHEGVHGYSAVDRHPVADVPCTVQPTKTINGDGEWVESPWKLGTGPVVTVPKHEWPGPSVGPAHDCGESFTEFQDRLHISSPTFFANTRLDVVKETLSEMQGPLSEPMQAVWDIMQHNESHKDYLCENGYCIRCGCVPGQRFLAGRPTE